MVPEYCSSCCRQYTCTMYLHIVYTCLRHSCTLMQGTIIPFQILIFESTTTTCEASCVHLQLLVAEYSSVCERVWTPTLHTCLGATYMYYIHVDLCTFVYTFVYRYYPDTRNITFRQPIHLYIQDSMHLFIALCLYALYVYYMYRFIISWQSRYTPGNCNCDSIL